MNIWKGRCLIAFLFLLSLLCAVRAQDAVRLPDKEATLVVLVTWDDADKTPTTGAYIEAHSFSVSHEKTFVLQMVKAGRYEAVLPPGVYDVFVSEPTSIPRCKRVFINGHTPYWNLMLEHDDIYTQQ